MSLNIAIIYGSVRTERQGIKAAKFVFNKLNERGHEVALVDPFDFNLPILDKKYDEFEPDTMPENIEKLGGILEKADAFVIVSGEYNHGVPPGLKNILDHFATQWRKKISAIATYSTGPFGGIRSEAPLRSTIGKLGAPAIPATFTVSGVDKAFDEEGKPLYEAYDRRIVKMIEELEWYGEAVKKARNNS